MENKSCLMDFLDSFQWKTLEMVLLGDLTFKELTEWQFVRHEVKYRQLNLVEGGTMCRFNLKKWIVNKDKKDFR